MLRDWRQWRVVRHTLSAATRRMSTKSVVKDKEKRSKTSELPWRFSDPISESDLPPNRSGILTQWRNLKMQIPAQFVLLLQVGSFYEIIHNDAIRVANAVEPPLHVASRTYSAGKTPLKTAGFPDFALETWLPRITRAGFMVALADQVQVEVTSPRGAKSVEMRRDHITRYITPGTMLVEEALEAGEPNYLMSIYMEPQQKGGANNDSRAIGAIAYADLSTGHFESVEITSVGELERELVRLAPAEVLLSLADHTLLRTTDGIKYERIFHRLQTSTFVSVVHDHLFAPTFAKPLATERASHAVRAYAKCLLGKAMPRLGTPHGRRISQYLQIGSETSAALELVNPISQNRVRAINETRTSAMVATLSANSNDSAPTNTTTTTTMPSSSSSSSLVDPSSESRSLKRTLYSTLNHTHTALGRRLLRSRVNAPSTNLLVIRERLDRTEAATVLLRPAQHMYLQQLRTLLKQCGDIERAQTLIRSARSADRIDRAPKGLRTIGETIGLVQRAFIVLRACLNDLVTRDDESQSPLHTFDNSQFTAAFDACLTTIDPRLIAHTRRLRESSHLLYDGEPFRILRMRNRVVAPVSNNNNSDDTNDDDDGDDDDGEEVFDDAVDDGSDNAVMEKRGRKEREQRADGDDESSLYFGKDDSILEEGQTQYEQVQEQRSRMDQLQRVYQHKLETYVKEHDQSVSATLLRNVQVVRKVCRDKDKTVFHALSIPKQLEAVCQNALGGEDGFGKEPRKVMGGGGATRLLYQTRQLMDLSQEVTDGYSQYNEVRQKALYDMTTRTLALSNEINRVAVTLAELDFTLAMATVASQPGYVRPQVDQSGVIDIVQGRHPVVEANQLVRANGIPFVPNDCRLCARTSNNSHNGSSSSSCSMLDYGLDELLQEEEEKREEKEEDAGRARVMIVTGPNMGGKSTFLRQSGLIVIMAQLGSFVPAERARIGIVDGLYARVGASDNIAGNESTFMVEMSETARILQSATPRSLVIIDELGRGTAHDEGHAIACAVTESLAERGCRTIIASHDRVFAHRFKQHLTETVALRQASVAVCPDSHSVIFTHELVEGIAQQSYGVDVAAMAGVHPDVVRRARHILEQLQRVEERSSDSECKADASVPATHLKVLDTLRQIDVDAVSPREAHRLLSEFVHSCNE